MTPRRLALLAFPKLTFLDLIGVYDALRRVASMGVAPGVSVTIVGTEPEVADDSGLVVQAQAVYPALAGYDMLFVPGGVGTRALMHDARFVQYLATWGDTRPLASVCTGSLLLGAAGYLKGVRATTHHNAFDALKPLCREGRHRSAHRRGRARGHRGRGGLVARPRALSRREILGRRRAREDRRAAGVHGLPRAVSPQRP